MLYRPQAAAQRAQMYVFFAMRDLSFPVLTFFDGRHMAGSFG